MLRKINLVFGCAIGLCAMNSAYSAPVYSCSSGTCDDGTSCTASGSKPVHCGCVEKPFSGPLPATTTADCGTGKLIARDGVLPAGTDTVNQTIILHPGVAAFQYGPVPPAKN